MLRIWDTCGRVHLPNLASGPDESVSHPVPQRGVHILPSGSQMRCLQHLARSRAYPPAGGLGRLADPTLVSPHFSGVDCPSHPCCAWSWLDAPEALHQSLPVPPPIGPALPLRQDPAPAWMLPGQPGSISSSRSWATELSTWGFLGANIPHLLASQLGPPSSSRAETEAP